jgi:hypothetical protein
MTRLRRFEVFLPLRFNDGQPVPEALGAEVFLDLRERFGATSCETQVIRGVWRRGEALFRDDLTRMFVDVPDTRENMEFFTQYKERLKERFQQVEIWITTYLVEAV